MKAKMMSYEHLRSCSHSQEALQHKPRSFTPSSEILLTQPVQACRFGGDPPLLP